VGSQRAAYCRLGIPLRRRYAEEHDKLIVRLSHLLGSVDRHKRVDLVEVPTGSLADKLPPASQAFKLHIVPLSHVDTASIPYRYGV